jgi:hypothetical protein
MPISRMQEPRQLYGLGSLVKKAVKGVTGVVKDIVKSPIGKAAALYFAPALIPGGASTLGGVLSNMKSAGGIAPYLFGTAGTGAAAGGGGTLGVLADLGLTKGFGAKGLTTLGKTAAFAAPSIAGAMFTPKEEEDMEALRQSGDRGLLAGYLRRYYQNLNPRANPTTVENFVRANMAYGGRMQYDGGGPTLSYEEAKAMNPGMFMDTTTSSYGDAGEGRPIPRFFEDKMQTLKESAGGMSPRGRIAIFKQYLDEALATGQISKEKYQEMLMPLFGQQGEIVTEQIKEYENFANGGRIGYAFGKNPEQNAINAAGIMGLPLNQNPAGVTELDLRETGGFIPPVGVKEKADDIPAMLSNNEFVFTAKSVKEMGDGDVNLGAQRMYDMMKKLENGGRV